MSVSNRSNLCRSIKVHPNVDLPFDSHSLEASIASCSVLCVCDNAKVGLAAFEPPGNLPVAIPLKEPLTSFRGFLRTVAEEFVIVGLDEFDPPAWQEYLL